MLDPFHNRPEEWEFYQPLTGARMLELGGKINQDRTYKAYFQSLGFEHISIDWNGEHGALRRDLRTPLWDEFGQFDMVCNIGTTEHVRGQPGVWANIHHMTRVGGVLVSITPYPDGKNWWWHGEHYPAPEFYEALEALNGWEIERMDSRKQPPHRLLCVRMVKRSDSPFVMPDESLIVYNQMRPRHWTPPC